MVPHHVGQRRRGQDLGDEAIGSDPLLDEAISLYPRMERFLKQGIYEADSYVSSVGSLSDLLSANTTGQTDQTSNLTESTRSS